MRSPLFPALLVFLALSTAHAAPAAAQDIAVAEALFDRGLADMKAGKYETGCKALAESQRLDPRPGTLFTLATCEADWGHIATAVSRFRDYLALYNTLSSEKKASQRERPKVAEETRARLLPEVPQLTLSLPKDAPAGTVVERNGEVVAAAALGIALPVDPGEHVLTTRTPNGAAREQRITIVKGEKKQVTLELAPGPAGAPGPGITTGPVVTPSPITTSSPPSAVQGDGPSGRRVATYVVGAAGALGLITGGVLGGLTVAQKGTLEKHCGAAIGSKDELECDPTGLDAASTGSGLGLGSTIAMAAGAAALGVAVVLFATESRPAKSHSTSRGPWVSAGVSAGNTGARFGVQGGW